MKQYPGLREFMSEIGSASIFLGEDFVRSAMGDLPGDAEERETSLPRPRVLVVDDEKLIADTCVEILKGAGFEAKTAYDGWAALEIAADFQPDYLLTDVLMPTMDGVELAICISKMLPRARILLFSGQAGISDALLRGHEQGYAFELVAKPIHPAKLIERLRQM
jgi:CheY-like chemotaxis protein